MKAPYVYLEPAMNCRLERLAAKTGKAKAELVRDGINLLLAEEIAKHGDPLLEIVGMAGEAGLPEASERHDDYLYGTGKRTRARRTPSWPGRGIPAWRALSWIGSWPASPWTTSTPTRRRRRGPSHGCGNTTRFSFVDAVSFAVMSEFGIGRALAFDR